MRQLVLATAANRGLRIGLAASAYGFGFRHGIDWDHLAAIADLTGSQSSSRRSMGLASLYAAGHAVVVLLIGSLAVLVGQELPASTNRIMDRVVGATLVLLGVYVLVALVRQGRDFRMRSRWMLLFSGARRGLRWVRSRADDEAAPALSSTAGIGAVPAPDRPRHGHRHLPDDPFADPGRATAFGVGMLHGIGAETPTQVLIFLTAAGVGGKAAGLLLLGCFVAGLLTSNTVVALAATFGFLGAARNFGVYVAVSVVTAAFSLGIGLAFLLGGSSALPALLGG